MTEPNADAARWTGPCPAHESGGCRRDLELDGGLCSTFVCPGCALAQPACFGGTSGPLCDACASEQDAAVRARLDAIVAEHGTRR